MTCQITIVALLQVPRVVDCVVGEAGQCDATGSWVRNHARDAVCGGRCGAACSCREVQIRLIVRKMKSQFRSGDRAHWHSLRKNRGLHSWRSISSQT